MIEIQRYRKRDGWPTRYWAVYVNGEILAVVVYRKGAEAIAEMLTRLKHRKEAEDVA